MLVMLDRGCAMSKKLRRHQTVIVEIASTSAYVMREVWVSLPSSVSCGTSPAKIHQKMF